MKRALITTLVAAAGLLPTAAAERSLPLDCIPDAVPRWDAAEPSPETRFGAQYLPGIVLGPPASSLPTQGATSVASLGHAGSMVWATGDIVIEDRPGPDFIVFENGFFRGAVPATAEDTYLIFVEPLFVEVSPDGETWFRFPHDADALAEARDGDGTVELALHRRLRGLAGVTPTFAGNWTVPDDSAVWDEGGTGGIAGAGGDAFDLAELGLTEARFVRLIDTNAQNGVPGNADGADIDALVVLHGRPVPPAALDSDGDGLADAVEQTFYGSLPNVADSDGDGTDDGREVAGCRDPMSASVEPYLVREPRLWLRGKSCTELRWSYAGHQLLYELVRGELAGLAAAGGAVDLGVVECLEAAGAAWRYDCDASTPLAGDALFYLVRVEGDAHYGRSSALEPRNPSSGECP